MHFSSDVVFFSLHFALLYQLNDLDVVLVAHDPRLVMRHPALLGDAPTLIVKKAVGVSHPRDSPHVHSKVERVSELIKEV